MDLLCEMWDAPERGKLHWTIASLSCHMSVTIEKTIEIINDLLETGTADGGYEGDIRKGCPSNCENLHTEEDTGGGITGGFIYACHVYVTLINRRMLNYGIKRDKEREDERKRQEKHRSHGSVTSRSQHVTGDISEVRSHISEEEESPIVPLKGDDDEFLKFWHLYPRKIGKGAAEKAWKKIRPSNGTVEKILSAVEDQKHWPIWERDNGRYIPNPATWLNQKRWGDERGGLLDEVPHRTAEQILAELRAKKRGENNA